MSKKRTDQSPKIQQMIHGKRNNEASSTIYDVFNWQLPDNIQLYHSQNSMRQDKSGSKQKRSDQDKVKIDEVNHEREMQQNYGQSKESLMIKNKCMKVHEVKDKLYEVDEIHLKRKSQISKTRDKDEKKGKSPEKQVRKLDINSESDRKILEGRTRKIQQFNKYTRDLSNSAYCAYYGKPVFEAYGRCNSSSELKTHNVMPHRGENHPQTIQTYEGALTNGKKIKIVDHLPRKPIENYPMNPNKTIEKNAEKASLPLRKPDLLNHIRFSEPKDQISRKQGVPSHADLIDKPKNKKGKKCKKVNKNSKTIAEYHNDGLKYMNTRYHLIDLLEEKKIRGSRLAYKVTECYPKEAVFGKNGSDKRKPAGIASKIGQPVENLIYRRI